MAKHKHLLTLQEVAELLRVNEATVYRMARDGGLPAVKVGRQWRFEKKRLSHWLRSPTLKSPVSHPHRVGGFVLSGKEGE